MKISLKWLKRHIDLDYSVEKISEILTDIGLEVEGIEEVESIQGGLKGVVVGHVLSKEKHPNADKLSLTKVDIGGEESLSIVCGAPNVDTGQKVLIATIGTKLYGDEGSSFTIKKSKIRGALSEGMICAEDELGLGKSHDGIMVLPEEVPIGTLASDYFNVSSDYVYEIGLTPNRSDATSHIGVAKDLAAYLKINEGHSGKLKKQEFNTFEKSNNTRPFKIDIKNQEACPRYSGITISNVVVKESPEWMQRLLNSIGVRPINNVVDITNFILHDLGQPLHAFDADKVSGDHIIVDTKTEGSTFVTLDEKERKLSEHDLMICDGNGNGLCIAGVFGGIGSGVTENTQNIFLESAHFNASWIRKTSTKHLLRTDAAKVYEKGSDPNITVTALKRAAALLAEFAEGTISSDIIDEYPKEIHPTEIVINYNSVVEKTGAEITLEEMNNILLAMEMEVRPMDEGSLIVKVPTNKADVLREADLIEEVLRIYGFNKVPIPNQVRSNINYSDFPSKRYIINKISNYLSDNGFNEMMGMSLIESKYYHKVLPIADDQLVFINNTSNIHLNIMRPEPMISGLLSVLHNQNHQQSDVKVYEVGRSYKKKSEDEFIETEFLNLFITGRRNQESWIDPKNTAADFYDVKKWVNRILSKLNIIKIKTVEIDDPRFEYGLQYLSQNMDIVSFGAVDTKVCKQLGIKGTVFYAEFSIKNLFNLARKQDVVVEAISKFPSMRRDLALVGDESMRFNDIQKIAQQSGKQILKEIDLFDIYKNKEQLGEGKKSYAVKFVFEDLNKTLSDKEVDKVIAKMTHRFEKELGIYIRS